MSSERQIAANRANAKRSTGPKTLVGKLTSSRNAFRHGFAGLQSDPATSVKVDAIALALAGSREDLLVSAKEFTRAQLELGRIRLKRTELTEKLRLDYNDIRSLRRMAALDRYERHYLTKRRRAVDKLQGRSETTTRPR
jgi:hypothetical protein